MSQTPTPRLTSVDGFRGIAALGVAWFHTYTQNGNILVSESAPAILNAVSVWGRFGVQLFFAISGLVLCYTLFSNREINRIKDVGWYFVRRSIRLDPTYWAILCLYIVLMPLLVASIPDSVPSVRYSAIDVLGNIAYFVPLSVHLYMPVAWTLAIEVQFYLFFAALILITNWAERDFGRNRSDVLRTLVVAAGMLSLVQLLGVAALPGLWLYQELHTFVIGMLVGLVLCKVGGSRELLLLFSIALLSVGVRNRDSYVVASVVSGALLYSGLFLTPIRMLLGNRVFQLFGSLSYCIYLLHQAVGGLTIHALQTLVGHERGGQQILIVILGVVATTCVASVFYILVERPTIRLSKAIRPVAGRAALRGALTRSVAVVDADVGGLPPATVADVPLTAALDVTRADGSPIKLGRSAK